MRHEGDALRWDTHTQANGERYEPRQCFACAVRRIRCALKLPAGTTPADVAHAVENLVERAR